MKHEPFVYATTDGRFRLSLPLEKTRVLDKWCQEVKTVETGGIILGRYDRQLQTACITHISGPPLDSRAGATWFDRGTRGLQALLFRNWQSRQQYYLGEWHFHPRGPLFPSPTDLSQMRDISKDDAYHCPEPLLLIAGFPSQDTSIPPNVPSVRCFVFPQGQPYQELLPYPG